MTSQRVSVILSRALFFRIKLCSAAAEPHPVIVNSFSSLFLFLFSFRDYRTQITCLSVLNHVLSYLIWFLMDNI